ncbi:N-succinylarginine dihydrolase [Parvularcula sp. LCG005]|uniref:N-succinylarginine dihydrolase n=1 Tax=Parvularcula sp. LCG005 TaxID=3078805 RepID=UPI0029437C4F|nr:N-succinylarginine dihydrolase [Parvularcula sp. LCG005]WOI53585.1 N-succinylarginine dihydrolase [Parvularcula sp. LCG005]
MTPAKEINFDGLVGPTHNYGGLSVGNVASMSSYGSASNPRAAARQGLSKMRALIRMGLTQGVLPPHERPFLPALRQLGFTGTDQAVIEAAAKVSPALLYNISSASNMWTANAATVSPSADSADGKVHFTPANLSAMYHRSIEHPFTARSLQTIFADDRHFAHHEAIPMGGAMGDEGAANHGRLSAQHGAPGIEQFVYGRSAFEKLESWRFLPRQAYEASHTIARRHGVLETSVFMRQSRRAIEAGAFHNDVVGVTNGPVLFYHEAAYEETGPAFDEMRRLAEPLGFEPIFVEVPESDVPLEDAITSYLFNSQLVTLPDGKMALILPGEAEATESTRRYLEGAMAGNGPISAAHFFDLKQSMKNGGGPACLRLRVVLTEAEEKAVAGGVILGEARLDALEAWVDAHYREELLPNDLLDPQLLIESRTALDALTQILDLGALYDFQR